MNEAQNTYLFLTIRNILGDISVLIGPKLERLSHSDFFLLFKGNSFVPSSYEQPTCRKMDCDLCFVVYLWSTRLFLPRLMQTYGIQCACLKTWKNELVMNLEDDQSRNPIKDTSQSIHKLDKRNKYSVHILPSTTLPSESVLQALMTSLPAANSSKQCCLLLSAVSLTRIFSRGIIPLGSLSVVNSK